MTFISVNARVVTDSTGAVSELPILLTPSGVLQPLLDYCLARSHNRSLSWMRKVVQATTLFLQYLKANPDEPESHRLFQNFAQRLYSGTFDRVTGMDPSNLCWRPYSYKNAGEIIHRLSDFLSGSATFGQKQRKLILGIQVMPLTVKWMRLPIFIGVKELFLDIYGHPTRASIRQDTACVPE